ncbi:MAG: hypothetical protein J6A75_12015 [Lachnospiraceae bacterium]|nr:hypothetical protein [Lachnospiraceae bacterium]
MARQDYMTIAVQKSTQEVFRKFVEIKGFTVKEALSDVLEMYMIAQDAELYLALKKDFLGAEEARNMILDRNEKVSKNDSLFMKLGYSETNDGQRLGGEGTIQAYIRNCEMNGYTWYSTNSLKSGMNEEKVRKYNALAEAGYLKMYFAMNQDDIDNDIAYVADVEEIVSYTQPTAAPCQDFEYPEEWTGSKNNIWIKIKNLKKEEVLSAKDFVVSSTGNELKGVIQKGQYIFGYISRR